MKSCNAFGKFLEVAQESIFVRRKWNCREITTVPPRLIETRFLWNY